MQRELFPLSDEKASKALREDTEGMTGLVDHFDKTAIVLTDKFLNSSPLLHGTQGLLTVKSARINSPEEVMDNLEGAMVQGTGSPAYKGAVTSGSEEVRDAVVILYQHGGYPSQSGGTLAQSSSVGGTGADSRMDKSSEDSIL
jgi:hypothetical protein